MVSLRVTEFTAWPSTRRLAQLMRKRLDATDDGGRIVLDFTGVEAATGGFSDELVAALVVEYADRVVVVGANPMVAETIAVALHRRGVAGIPDEQRDHGKRPQRTPTDGRESA